MKQVQWTDKQFNLFKKEYNFAIMKKYKYDKNDVFVCFIGSGALFNTIGFSVIGSIVLAIAIGIYIDTRIIEENNMEHEFKIGDWVILTYRYDDCIINTVQKYIGEFGEQYAFNPMLNNRNSAPKDRATLTHWQPKIDEWCWFQTCNCGFELGQFVEQLSIDQYRYRLNSTNSLFNCNYCEPFFGPLPTSLK